MKRIALLVPLFLLAADVAADTEAGLTAIQDLGQLNGQALACGQLATAGQVKALMIRHAPKTRRYGEVFEMATNASYLKQGENQEGCLQAVAFDGKVRELTARLQASLPAAQ